LRRFFNRNAERLESILQTLLQYFRDRRHPLVPRPRNNRTFARWLPNQLAVFQNASVEHI
jgi:hypothetical protein